MLHFLRRIRRGLINTGATRKYVIYARGEIILVVIGILIALQLNSWKEEINTKEELNKSMYSMLDDLSEDIAFYNAQIEKIGKRIILLNDFAQGNFSKVDIESIADNLSYNIENKNFGTTYKSLKEDRKYNMIKNSELKKKITSYYEVYCKEYSSYSSWHKKFVTETIESYILLNLPYKRGYKVDAKDVINELENGKLLSITNFQISIQDDAILKIMNNNLLAEELSLFINSEFN
jgi:hypothetical protein